MTDEPTDEQIAAALEAYWTTAVDHAKAQTLDYDTVMRDCMRAALIAAARAQDKP